MLSGRFLVPNRYSSASRSVVSVVQGLSSGLYSYVLVTLLVSLLLLNLSGNIPGLSIPTLFYFFSSSVSLTFWIALVIVISFTQLKGFISHMLPYGSPEGLMLLLPLIEVFSQIIRPFTLIIRLSTNLSSGHIIMYIFSFFSVRSLTLTFGLAFVLAALFCLEVMISCLQAYIFSSLVLLYVNETLYSRYLNNNSSLSD